MQKQPQISFEKPVIIFGKQASGKTTRLNEILLDFDEKDIRRFTEKDFEKWAFYLVSADQRVFLIDEIIHLSTINFLKTMFKENPQLKIIMATQIPIDSVPMKLLCDLKIILLDIIIE